MKRPDFVTIALLAAGVYFLLAGQSSVFLPPPPIKSPGFVVVVIEETADRSRLKPGQLDTLTGSAPGTPRQYVVANGGEWRVLDQSPKSVELESPAVREAHALPRSSLPWIVASDGRTGFSRPLHDTLEETLADLQKLKGPKP